MANPHRGEVELRVGEKLYTFRFSLSALASLEEMTGTSVELVFQRFLEPGTPKLRPMLQIVRAALLDRHPEVTEEEAGELILEAGVDAVTAAILKTAETSLERLGGAKPGAAPPGPPRAPPAGTGS